ncbi:MAG: PTS sugar transporter subunit IIA [Treponema sp.]|nr:PTS sugar transporter subunit IIA [Treponema sp.]
MLSSKELCDLIAKGGVVADIKGSTINEVYENFTRKINLPDGLYADVLNKELIERENVLSTAVGKGIAIPHPRKQLIHNPSDERIAVCFPKEQISMQSPDSAPVFAFFVLLTYTSQSHLAILSTLAALVQNKDFVDLLKTKPNQKALFDAIKMYCNN